MVEALQGPAKEEEVGLVEVEMEGGEGRFEGEVGGGGGEPDPPIQQHSLEGPL